ncbi:MAG TPA: hypothetical protein ENK05_04305 [Gammaproteobacteria bacterium]|nr:hypothetical protein [Gammaproteobacteria bacterium]
MVMATRCASQVQAAEPIDIHYGRVTAEAPVDVKNHVGESALVGGVLGSLTARLWNTGSATGDVVTGSAVGAATGAAVESIGEWRMKGVRYTVESVKEGELHIITDQTGVRVGDCVAIESSRDHANIRRVSDVYCEAAQSGVTDQHLHERVKRSAGVCYQAKKALLGAQSAEELEQAKRRVRALCDT